MKIAAQKERKLQEITNWLFGVHPTSFWNYRVGASERSKVGRVSRPYQIAEWSLKTAHQQRIIKDDCREEQKHVKNTSRLLHRNRQEMLRKMTTWDQTRSIFLIEIKFFDGWRWEERAREALMIISVNGRIIVDWLLCNFIRDLRVNNFWFDSQSKLSIEGKATIPDTAIACVNWIQF